MTNHPSGASDPSFPSDEELLAEAGLKPWMFSLIYERYYAPFYRKALSIVRDPRDAEEVVLDAFTKIYVNANKFTPEPGAQFSSWAYRILMNTAFTRYQKLSKEKQRFALLDPEFEEYVGEMTNHSGFKEETDGIDRILNRLPGHFAYVLRLHYLERWSHEDIAKETGENVGTIKARIHRAKAAFKKESKGGEAEALM